MPPIRNVPGTRSGPQRSERSRNGRNAAHQATSKRVQEAAEAQYASQMNNNKLISAASSYNIERSLIAPLVGKVALFHATQALLAQGGAARLAPRVSKVGT